MRKIFLILNLCLLLSWLANAQKVLSPQQALEKAIQTHPLGLQFDDLNKINQLDQQIIQSGWLPRLSVSGKASFQSEVIDIPISMPGVEIGSPSGDQYNIALDLTQTIYDGGMLKNQAKLKENVYLSSRKETEVDIYQTLEKVTNIYFRRLILQESLKIVELGREELTERLETIESGVRNGVQTPSAQWMLEAELLNLEKSENQILSAINSTNEMMEILIGEPVGNTVFILPEISEVTDEIHRPELSLFDLQKEQLNHSSALTQTALMPRVQAFASAGYGRPGLNPINDEFDFYYMAGIQLNWKLWDWKQNRREREKLMVREEIVESGRQHLLKNIQMGVTQSRSNIQQTEADMQINEKMMLLQERIVENASSKLENGVITSDEYLHQFNQLLKTRNDQQIYKVKLQQEKFHLMFLTGNLPVNIEKHISEE